jgi:hypothetical protein
MCKLYLQHVILNLPTGFPHSGDLAFQRELAKHDSADTKFAIHTTASTGDLASILFASRELRFSFHFFKYAFTCHVLSLFLIPFKRHTELFQNEFA